MIDYVKAIEIIAQTFGAEKNYKLEATHDKVDIFDIELKNHRHEDVRFRIIYLKTKMDITFPKSTFAKNDFQKWLGRLEYEMEQAYLRNVKIDVLEETKEYRLRLSM